MNRLRSLQAKLKADLLILTSRDEAWADVYYYSGEETRPAAMVVTPDDASLYSDDKGQPLKEFRDYAKKLKGKRIAIDEYSASAAFLMRLAKKNKIVPFGKQLLQLREIKEPVEIKNILQAQKITKQCVAETQFYGKSENHAAGLLELKARQKGCALNAFPPIVASGEKTSVPHAVTSENKIRHGQPLLIDVGVRYECYCGDYSTTLYGGQDKQIKDAIVAVKEAKKAAEKLAKPGTNGKRLSDTAYNVLVEYGFKGHTFRDAGLSLGHHVGLDVHDGWRNVDRTPLRKGMAFTIEPGVYVKGKFGVRFEDIIVLE